MAKLKINELQVTGAELFADAETFLNDLTDEELKGAVGGMIYPTTIYSLLCIPTNTLTVKTSIHPYTIVIL